MKTIILSFVLAIIVSLTFAHNINSQPDASVEKIESIIKLTKFIDWSGKNEILNSKQLLYVLTDKQIPINYEISSKKNAVYQNWQIVFTESIRDFDEGSVVFITKQKHSYINDVIKLSQAKNILTIAEENNDFCTKGGMINIARRNNGHKFEINYKIIQQKSLNISSKVLALAKIYNE
jgi:hypothetical protein